MSVLKAHEVDRFLDKLKPGTAPFCVMAYGPDRGLVADCLRRFAEATGVDLSDTLSVSVLDGATLAADPGRLADELNGPGLFGGTRLVRLREAGNDKRLVEAVSLALQSPTPEAFLAIEGGDLKRSSALLKAFERSRSGTALPCYADDARAVQRTIERMIESAGKVIEPGAETLLSETLGGDRLATRSELDKLLLYAGDADAVTVDDVRAVVGDAGATAADDAVDGVLTGDRGRFERAYGRLLASKSSPFLVLRDLSQQLQWLERAQDGASNAAAAVKRIEGFGPRLHFRRVPALRAAAQALSPTGTSKLLDEATDAVLKSRKEPMLESEIVRELCLRILGQVAGKHTG